MDGKDVFFHHSDLRGLGFDSLKKGQLLEFEIKVEAKGPYAVNVRSSEKTKD